MIHTFTLINLDELAKSFVNMSYKSKQVHADLKNKLLNTGKVSVRETDMLGHEYLIWLEKRGIVKRK